MPLILSYSFDELRPFRLLHHLRDEDDYLPTILGAAEFLNFAEVERASGRAEALRQLRTLVMNHFGLYP